MNTTGTSMIDPPLNKLSEKVDCRYTLVSVVAKRAKQIVEHPEEAYDASKKPVSAAVDDLINDRLEIVQPIEGE